MYVTYIKCNWRTAIESDSITAIFLEILRWEWSRKGVLAQIFSVIILLWISIIVSDINKNF